MQSDINRATWSRREYVGQFPSAGTWTDEGERRATGDVLERVPRPDVLDLGVGTGRTAGLVADRAASYVGLDYSPAMIERARLAYPDLDLRVGDARDLGAFAAGQVSLTLFSFNGIDAVAHGDRAQVLAEIFRVTRPGGFALYSTLNRGGPLYRERPWWLYEPGHPEPPPPRSRQLYLRGLRSLVGHPRRYANWLRLRRFTEHHDDWSVGVLSAHDFAILAHFIEPAAAVREARAAGFEVTAVYDTSGTALDPSRPDTDAEWIHLIVGKASR